MDATCHGNQHDILSYFLLVSNTLCWLFLLVKRATFRVFKCHGNQHFAGRIHGIAAMRQDIAATVV